MSDDSVIMEVGHWTKIKHSVLEEYAHVFMTAMKGKWEELLYLDLFAGAGSERIRGTQEVIDGSPIIALRASPPFTRYVFCEKEPTRAQTLRDRIEKDFPSYDATVLTIDSNDEFSRVEDALGKLSNRLTLTFIDPYKSAQLRFETIKRLNLFLRSDVLVLIPTYMDIHRNLKAYSKDDKATIDELLGSRDWRTDTDFAAGKYTEFGTYVLDKFGQRMRSIGYIYESPAIFKSVHIGGESGPRLYHLGFFSRHSLAIGLWKGVVHGTAQQRLFPLE